MDQNEVHYLLLAGQREQSHKKFLDTPRKAIKLSKLKEIYEHGSRAHAISLLTSRRRLVIDRDYIFDGDDPNLAYRAKNNGAVDFLCCVPKRPGFEAVLPNPPVGDGMWSMDFTKWNKEFKSKHADFGFDAKGRMLYMGQFGGEDLWGTWVPNKWFQQRPNDAPVSMFSSGDTRMSKPLAMWTILFMAYVLHEQGISDVIWEQRQPDDLQDIDDLRGYTNLA